MTGSCRITQQSSVGEDWKQELQEMSVKNVKAELLKYRTDDIAKEIAIIYNEIARTGDYPKEIIQGVITAIQKPGKTKGPIENFYLLLQPLLELGSKSTSLSSGFSDVIKAARYDLLIHCLIS